MGADSLGPLSRHRPHRANPNSPFLISVIFLFPPLALVSPLSFARLPSFLFPVHPPASRAWEAGGAASRRQDFGGIGPDTYPTGAPSHAPTATAAETRAKALRELAFAACKEGYLVDCEKDLDDAKALDPAGEALPEVLAARRQVSALPPPGRNPK